MLLCQFLRHPPGTHLTELKAVINQGIGKTNTHDQPSCSLFNCYSSVFTNHFQGSFFIPRGCGCSWTSGALCICQTRVAIFKHLNLLIGDSTTENFIPILSTNVEMNLCSWHIFYPQKAYDRMLFLFGAIYKFRSHLHHSVTTLILNYKVSRLADWLVTWHSQIQPITTTPTLTVSRENIKARKLFEHPS